MDNYEATGSQRFYIVAYSNERPFYCFLKDGLFCLLMQFKNLLQITKSKPPNQTRLFWAIAAGGKNVDI